MRTGRIFKARMLSLGLATVVASLALAASASAVIIKLPSGEVLSYQPTPAKAKTVLPPPDAAFSNLDYNGGPVMPSSTNYVIYWAPSGTDPYPGGYQTGLDQYLTDLAHDSGGHQNTDAVAAQYNDTFGNFARYQVGFGGSFVDTTAYPADGCGPGAVTAGTTCLTDAQLRAELTSFVSAHSLPADLKHQYFLVFPPGVANCFDSTPSHGCSANTRYPAYCAYHSATSRTDAIIYSNDPYVSDTTCTRGSQFWSNGPSDGLIDGGLSHEHIESITDPIPNTAWADFTNGGYEIGDKCAYVFGLTLGGNGTAGSAYYNQVINGHHYYYQTEWSNQGSACLNHPPFFPPRTAQPLAKFSSTPAAGTQMNFDATGSFTPGGVSQFHWQFEDTYHALAEFEAPTPTATYAYPAPGRHIVSLTTFGSDGTSVGTSRVIATGHTGPTPSFSDSPSAPSSGQSVAFDGSGSSGPDAAITFDEWNFGDGATESLGPVTAHTYAAPGVYYPTLTVTDSLGQKASSMQRLVVGGPTLTTTAATNVTATAASLNSTINPGGTDTMYKYEYGPSTAFGSFIGPFDAGSGTSSTAQPSKPIASLSPATTYYYRVCGNNAANPGVGDQVCGAVLSFTTAGSAVPSADTLAADSITTSAATLHGTVNAHGSQTAYTFEWGTSHDFGHITPVDSAGLQSADLPVMATLTGLDDDTVYFYRLVATNASGTTVGATHTLATDYRSSLPNVHTGPATNITATSATLTGQVNPKFFPTAFTFEYGTNPQTSFQITAVDQTPGGYLYDQDVSLPATGLAPHTTYYYRIVASSSAGTSVGPLMAFTTAA